MLQLAYQCRESTRNFATRIPCNFPGGISSTTVPRTYTLHNPYRPRITKADAKYFVYFQKTRTMSLGFIEIRLRYHSQSSCKALYSWHIVEHTHWYQIEECIRWLPTCIKRRKHINDGRRGVLRASLYPKRRWEWTNNKWARERSIRARSTSVTTIRAMENQTTEGKVPTVQHFSAN